jgi:hypothetical protein
MRHRLQFPLALLGIAVERALRRLDRVRARVAQTPLIELR